MKISVHLWVERRSDKGRREKIFSQRKLWECQKTFYLKNTESDDWETPLDEISVREIFWWQSKKPEKHRQIPYEQFPWNAAHIATAEHWGSWWYG